MIGEEYVEAIGYIREEPYQNYLGEGISLSQRGIYITFKEFVERYYDKYEDTEVKDPFEITNLVDRQELFEKMSNDISEPDAINKVLDH